ncbi:MAG TPA: glycosyltransferase, partial [Ornithinimicrobium sp.]
MPEGRAPRTGRTGRAPLPSDASRSPSRDVSHVVVAIPAKNEALLLGACLRSVNETVRSLRLGTGVGSVCVMVALDGCTDGTAAVA